MKKLFVMLALMVCSMTATIAQSSDRVEVDITKLSTEELQVWQKLKTKEAKANEVIAVTTPDKMLKYAEVGKAFGQAFKECWSAVSTDAEKFAQSPAGKWAMILVSWKIMGQDAIDITKSVVKWGVGICLLSVGVPFWAYIFNRNCVAKRVLLSKERTGLFAVKKVYDKNMSDPIHGDEGAPILYAVTFAIFIGIVALIMFV